MIGSDDDAARIVSKAFDQFEQQAKGIAGELRGVKPFALRAAEQLCRVAGVLAAFAGRTTFHADDARGALALVLHSVKCWRQVIEQGAADPGAGHALRLYEWLIGQPGHRANGRDILRSATPHALRGKDTRDAALERLQAHALIDREGPDVRALLPGEDDDGQA